MYKSITTFLADESGATLVEYGLIAALISVVAIAALTNVGAKIKATFETIDTKLTPPSVP
jgi:pilus assembly protein Flp/PilA